MENSREMPRLQRDIASEIRLMKPWLHGTGADGSGPLGLVGVSHAARAVDAEDCGVARSRRLSEFAGYSAARLPFSARRALALASVLLSVIRSSAYDPMCPIPRPRDVTRRDPKRRFKGNRARRVNNEVERP